MTSYNEALRSRKRRRPGMGLLVLVGASYCLAGGGTMAREVSSVSGAGSGSLRRRDTAAAAAVINEASVDRVDIPSVSTLVGASALHDYDYGDQQLRSPRGSSSPETSSDGITPSSLRGIPPALQDDYYRQEDNAQTHDAQIAERYENNKSDEPAGTATGTNASTSNTTVETSGREDHREVESSAGSGYSQQDGVHALEGSDESISNNNPVGAPIDPRDAGKKKSTVTSGVDPQAEEKEQEEQLQNQDLHEPLRDYSTEMFQGQPLPPAPPEEHIVVVEDNGVKDVKSVEVDAFLSTTNADMIDDASTSADDEQLQDFGTGGETTTAATSKTTVTATATGETIPSLLPHQNDQQAGGTRASLAEHLIPIATDEEIEARLQEKNKVRQQVEKNAERSYELSVHTECSHYNCKEVSSPEHHPDVWVTVGSNGAKYRSVEAALASGAKNIYIREGTYEIDQTIIIGQNHRGVHIRGASREKTILKFIGMESFLVLFNTRDVSISNLTLDAKSANHAALKAALEQQGDASDKLRPNQMWQVVGVVNSSGISIVDTIIRAPKTMNAVFFAGSFFSSSRVYSTFFGGSKSRYNPGESETVQAYKAGFLDEDNTVRNNHIYSENEGDALVFTLQKNGVVRGNKVTSGAISFFMNRDSTCNMNTVLKSPIYGIYVTVPSNNIEVADNKIIHSTKSGIKVARMTDHVKQGLPTMHTTDRLKYRASGVSLIGNQLFDIHSIGIEVELTRGAVIEHNSISRSDYSGIFLQHSDKALVRNNRLEDFGMLADHHEHNAGIYGAAAVTKATITNNIIIDFLSHGARYGLKIAPLSENTECVMSQNTISGQYTSGESISGPSSTIQVDNTVIA